MATAKVAVVVSVRNEKVPLCWLGSVEFGSIAKSPPAASRNRKSLTLGAVAGGGSAMAG